MDAFCWEMESSERNAFDVARVDSSTNSQRHRVKLFCGDYYLNILAYCQEYLIQHDYHSLYLNSYYMNCNSTNLYCMICVHAICMFKICINTILSKAICIYNLYLYNLYLYSLYLDSSLMYCQEYLIYHDHWSSHLVLHLEQRHTVGHMNSHNQINSCHYCHYVNSYIQMNSCLCVNSYKQMSSHHCVNSYNQMNSHHYKPIGPMARK